MTPALLLQALLTYGPTVIPMAQKLFADVKSGKTEVTAEDFAELQRLATQSSGDIYLRLGIDPPPAAAK